MKKQTKIIQENICNYVYDKELVSQIHKEISKSSKTPNSIKKIH